MIIDIHTHGNIPKRDGILRITNIRAGIDDIVCTYPFSYGIHPYDVEKVDIGHILSMLDRINPAAIGEIGMDFRFQETAAKQSRYFGSQIEKAAKMDKPVIIHAVRCLPQVLSIMSRYTLSFVIHGFRGTIRQMEEIVRIGGFVSLSPYLPAQTTEIFNKFSENILLETDETEWDIREHYGIFAEQCGVSVTELETIIENNFIRWIGNRELCSCLVKKDTN